MKKIFITLFLMTLSYADAQNISDFKYVVVPNQFDDFTKEDYQLNTYLKTLLRKKKYEIIVEDSGNYPPEFQQNRCLATNANIQNIKSSFQNKLKVVFTDCNENVVAEYEGSSKIKDFEKGYQDALNDAMNKLVLQNSTAVSQTLIKEQTKVTTKDKPTSLPKIQVEAVPLNYSDGSTTVGLIFSENGQFLLSIKDNQIAKFKPTLKPNIFVVELQDANGKKYPSIGYTTANTISFEYLDSNNKLQERVFTKVK